MRGLARIEGLDQSGIQVMIQGPGVRPQLLFPGYLLGPPEESVVGCELVRP